MSGWGLAACFFSRSAECAPEASPEPIIRGERGWDDMFEERDVWSLKVR